MSKIYEERVEEIRLVLAGTTFHFPHIVDVDWRLDYHVKSTQLSKVNKPVWLINLKTFPNDSTSLQDVNFTCNLQDIQDLLIRLKDAIKQVERITGTK